MQSINTYMDEIEADYIVEKMKGTLLRQLIVVDEVPLISYISLEVYRELKKEHVRNV